LYEMLINHNLFEGVEADTSAIAIVQNELKHYIVKRLEILMGLRHPTPQQKTIVESDFNPIEVDFLKQLAYRGTKGASAEYEEDYEEEEEEAPRPVAKPKPLLNPIKATVKSSSLKSVAKTKPSVKKPPVVKKSPPAPAPKKTVKKKVQPKAEPLPSKPKRKAKKSGAVTPKIKNTGVAPRQLNQQEIEALAKADLEQMKTRKPFDKMTAKEKAEEIARVNAQHAPKPKPATALPPMDSSQLMMKYTAEQASRASSTGNKNNPFDAIMANVANKIAMEKSQE
jgi:hypothetical protein